MTRHLNLRSVATVQQRLRNAALAKELLLQYNVKLVISVARQYADRLASCSIFAALQATDQQMFLILMQCSSQVGLGFPSAGWLAGRLVSVHPCNQRPAARAHT